MIEETLKKEQQTRVPTLAPLAVHAVDTGRAEEKREKRGYFLIFLTFSMLLALALHF